MNASAFKMAGQARRLVWAFFAAMGGTSLTIVKGVEIRVDTAPMPFPMVRACHPVSQNARSGSLLPTPSTTSKKPSVIHDSDATGDGGGIHAVASNQQAIHVRNAL